MAEGRISELEDMSTEIPELKQKRKKAEKKKKTTVVEYLRTVDNCRKFNIGIMGIPEEQKKKKEKKYLE